MKTFLFENDFHPDAKLPSPEQLKFKILLKNKKKPPELSQLTATTNALFEGWVLV